MNKTKTIKEVDAKAIAAVPGLIDVLMQTHDTLKSLQRVMLRDDRRDLWQTLQERRVAIIIALRKAGALRP